MPSIVANFMKRISLIAAILCMVSNIAVKAEDNSIYTIVEGQDYYIYNTYYNRVLAPSSTQDSPRLVEYNAENDEQYLFTAEKSTINGFIKLRHKASGKYMAASSSNSYSVILNQASSTSATYDWRIRMDKNGQLVNRKNTSATLGVDRDETTDEIGVWYDKAQGDSTTFFHIFPSNDNGMEASRKAWAIRDLGNVVDFIDQEMNTGYKYPLGYRNKMPKSVLNARYWINNETEYTLEQFMNRATTLRDSVANMINGFSNVMLTATEMDDFGSSFSLGISDFALNEANASDSVYILIRSKEGEGMRYTMSQPGNYVFTFETNKVKVYLNGSPIDEISTYTLPQYSMQGTEAEWTIMRSTYAASYMPELLSETKAVTTGGGVTVDKYGNNTRKVILLKNAKMDLDEQIDLHIISESAPLTKCNINLVNEKAWLIFDNNRPSDVIKNYLSQISINGVEAKVDVNCRVVIYLNGALVMPYVNSAILTGYDGEQYTGEAIEYKVGGAGTLGKNSNRMRSFRLKRGYMATLATGTSGSGYSRVYVADHNDIEVPVLPDALRGRVSSIIIKKWQYVSKKGWCSTTSNSAIATETSKVRATWFYTWSADRASTYDTEYIPIRQHIYWPSIGDISGHTSATACLSFNEPEHSEQHTDCACGGTISAWTACEKTPDFQVAGMRIGSPAPTDASWLTEYITNVNNMAYRCDFVAFHAYWGTNEATNGQAWYNKLKSIYDSTKRPIWITEWNNGASWTTESWPDSYSAKLEKQRKAMKEILNVLDTCSFVERYAFYNWDTYYRCAINWDDGSLLPAGRVYRDSKSDFAYNSKVQFTPIWWKPGIKTPTMTARINEVDNELVVNIENKNGDLTDILTIQRLNGEGTWEDYYTETLRYKFDNETLKYSFPLSDFDIENTQLRLYIKRTVGDEVTGAPVTTGYVQNPNILVSSKNEVPGWTCVKDASAGYTKATGDTYMEVWNETAAGMHFDYYQDIEDLPAGIYELSAAVFNTADGTTNNVNGSVVLYAQADSVQYATPVTEDSQIDYNRRTTVSGIAILGGKIRIGIKNIGEMGGRWAGGDEFKLVRIAELTGDGHQQYMEARRSAEQRARELFFKQEGTDASAYIINPSCKRSNTYGWTVENSGTGTGEASDGNASNVYWNLWKGSAFTSTMSQDINYLPEGKYSVKALLRGSTNEEFTLSATVFNGNGEEKEQKTATITPTGNVSEGGSPYQKGWQLAETPQVIVRTGDTLRIGMQAKNTSGSAWWSADDFGLRWEYVEPLPDGIEVINNGQLIINNRAVYDLGGRRVGDSQLKRGLYIKNGKKVVVK